MPFARDAVEAKGAADAISLTQEGAEQNAAHALLHLINLLPLSDCRQTRLLKSLEELFPYGDNRGRALGIAVAQKVRGFDSYTYAIVGDGESQEGQVWEAAECAGAWGVDNFIAFTDLNRQQLDGYTEDIIPMHHLKERYETFGFDAYEIDGHDFNAIADAVASAKRTKGKPHMIILNTVKSFGYIPGEGIKNNHSMSIDAAGRDKAVADLIAREGESV